MQESNENERIVKVETTECVDNLRGSCAQLAPGKMFVLTLAFVFGGAVGLGVTQRFDVPLRGSIDSTAAQRPVSDFEEASSGVGYENRAAENQTGSSLVTSSELRVDSAKSPTEPIVVSFPQKPSAEATGEAAWGDLNARMEQAISSDAAAARQALSAPDSQMSPELAEKVKTLPMPARYAIYLAMHLPEREGKAPSEDRLPTEAAQ